MNGTRVSFADITKVYYHTYNRPWKFQHIDIILSKEDSQAIGEYVRRILGNNMALDSVLTRILEMGIHKAKEQVSLDKYLDECDKEASE